MPQNKGMIVLMGSGELASTMVEVHKGLLAGLGGSPKAVFVDTPAGFQLNVDEISQKALEYFSRRVNQPMALASLKTAEAVPGLDAKDAYGILESADYILIGPGSPSYAARQWRKNRIPEIFISRVEAGACLVAASAAALALGRFTLPVYEVYKVGEDLHWISGVNMLNHFGFNLAVVPHWNNADGGSHDTRFCYMGKPRMDRLMHLLPEEVGVLGIDEHTACILDFENNTIEIKGVGSVTLKDRYQEFIFNRGEIFPLDVLRNFGLAETKAGRQPPETPEIPAHSEMDAPSQASSNGIISGYAPQKIESLNTLVEALLETRTAYRNAKKFKEADAIRKCLEKARIRIEDGENQSFWRLEG